MPADITNKKVLKFISLETAIAFTVTVIGVTTAIQVLASDVEAAKTDVGKIQVQQEAIQKDVAEISTSISVMRAKMESEAEHHKEYHKDMKADMSWIRRNLESRDR